MDESKSDLKPEPDDLLGSFSKKEEVEGKPATKNSWNQSMISSCRICLSSILDPAKLVCGHRFCESCLHKYWQANEEPNFVVCPLCRDYAFKIGFVQKDSARSTRDFRKKFDPEHVDMPSTLTKPVELGSRYLRVWPLVMPLIYFVVKLVKPILMDLLVLLK